MATIDATYRQLNSHLDRHGFRGLLSVPGEPEINIKRVPHMLLEHNMSEGFPILTTKPIYWQNIIQETIFAFSNASRLAQTDDLIEALECNPSNLTHVLPPSLYETEAIEGQFYAGASIEVLLTEKGFALKWHQTSCDVFNNLPSYLVAYATIGSVIEKQLSLPFEKLIGSLSNCYVCVSDMPLLNKQLKREPVDYEMYLSVTAFATLRNMDIKDFQVVNYSSRGELT